MVKTRPSCNKLLILLNPGAYFSFKYCFVVFFVFSIIHRTRIKCGASPVFCEGQFVSSVTWDVGQAGGST